MSRVHTILDDLMLPGAVRMEFQPIVRVDGDGTSLYMFEALARGPRNTTMERPDVMFEYARRKGMEAQLDLLCITAALSSFAQIAGDPRLSLNVHASTLASVPHFAAILVDRAAAVGITPQRLMLEIIEQRNPWAAAPFQAALCDLRTAGVAIAIDDLGKGLSNYELLVDCRPDHIKIDRSIVKGCSSDRWRRAVLASVARLASDLDATAIAEGVEESADLDTMRELGIDTFQGWLFARAMPASSLTHSPAFRQPLTAAVHQEKTL